MFCCTFSAKHEKNQLLVTFFFWGIAGLGLIWFWMCVWLFLIICALKCILLHYFRKSCLSWKVDLLFHILIFGLVGFLTFYFPVIHVGVKGFVSGVYFLLGTGSFFKLCIIREQRKLEHDRNVERDLCMLDLQLELQAEQERMFCLQKLYEKYLCDE